MKIAIDLGHGVGRDRGAGKNGEEEKIIALVGNQIIGHLRNLGHQVILTRPADSGQSVGVSINQRYTKANNEGVEMLVSVHANAFNGTAKGSEILTYNAVDKLNASKILKEFEGLGFVNRGIKNSIGVAGIVGSAKAPAMLIELGFCDNPEEMDRMVKNHDVMARIIVSNITGTNIRVGGNVGKKTCAFALDNVDLRFGQGAFLRGWIESEEFTLFINGNDYGVRKCEVHRADVEKALGKKGNFGFDIGIVKEALNKGENEIRLEWYDTKIIYNIQWK